MKMGECLSKDFIFGRCWVAVILLSLLAHSGISRRAYGGTALGWFGNDARNAAMGGGGTAAGRGFGNLLVNPALMSFCPGGAWLSFSFAPSGLEIDPKDRPAGYDVPDAIYYGDENDEGRWWDRSVPTELLTNSRESTNDLPTEYLLSLGVISSFGVPGLRIGLGASLPLPTLIDFNAWYADEREQNFTNRLHFERFGEFDHLLAIYAGISYSPLDWVSIGFSVKIDLSLGFGTGLYFPQGDQWEYAYLTPSGEVKPAVRPIGGLAFKTPIGLNFGLVYRHESYMNIDLDIDIRLWSVEQGQDGPQNHFFQEYRFVAGYEPTKVELAAAYENDRFTVEIGTAWERWSQYVDRHGNHWSEPEFASASPSEAEWKPSFEDVFTVRGGGEVWVVDFASVRAGVAYYPSPMPSQTGRFNYVDNDLLLYSLGAGFRFELRGTMVTVDLAGQIWHMQALTINKSLPDKLPADEGGIVDEVPDSLEDMYTGGIVEGAKNLQTNNPGFPGYSFGGVVFNGMLMFGMEFK
jgi:long-chain fatty acid transport protein